MKSNKQMGRTCRLLVVTLALSAAQWASAQSSTIAEAPENCEQPCVVTHRAGRMALVQAFDQAGDLFKVNTIPLLPQARLLHQASTRALGSSDALLDADGNGSKVLTETYDMDGFLMTVTSVFLYRRHELQDVQLYHSRIPCEGSCSGEVQTGDHTQSG